MNCGEVEEKLLLRQSDELGADECARLDEHLSQCERCRSLAADTKAVLDAVGAAPAMPEALANRILEKVRARTRAVRKPHFAAKLARDFGMAAAVSIAATILFFLTVPAPREPASPAPQQTAAANAAKTADTQDETLARELRRAINKIDSTRTTALGESFGSELDKVKDNVDATKFLLTTAGRSGLEKQIGDVKEKIQTLREEMTNLALYTGGEQNNSN